MRRTDRGSSTEASTLMAPRKGRVAREGVRSNRRSPRSREPKKVPKGRSPRPQVLAHHAVPRRREPLAVPPSKPSMTTHPSSNRRSPQMTSPLSPRSRPPQEGVRRGAGRPRGPRAHLPWMLQPRTNWWTGRRTRCWTAPPTQRIRSPPTISTRPSPSRVAV